MRLTISDLGWDNFFQQQTLEDDMTCVDVARVTNVQRSGFRILGDQIDEHLPVSCAEADDLPVVGDWLILARDTRRIVRVLDRKSVFRRRAPGSDRQEQLLAANVDTLFVVSSCNQDFNEARLERYLALGHDAGVMTVIVLTRKDLCDDAADYAGRAARLSPGVPVEVVNALDAADLDVLQPWLTQGQTVALLGSSGVGKSTLTNTLLGNGKLATRGIREDDARGRHTTTSRSLYRLPGGGWLLDTPGMRELQLAGVKAGLDDVFAEIAALANDCRFSDCRHESEPGCAVHAAVAEGRLDSVRLERWRKLVREEARNTASLAEKRAQDRGFGRLIKGALEEKNARKDGRN